MSAVMAFFTSRRRAGRNGATRSSISASPDPRNGASFASSSIPPVSSFGVFSSFVRLSVSSAPLSEPSLPNRATDRGVPGSLASFATRVLRQARASERDAPKKDVEDVSEDASSDPSASSPSPGTIPSPRSSASAPKKPPFPVSGSGSPGSANRSRCAKAKHSGASRFPWLGRDPTQFSALAPRAISSFSSATLCSPAPSSTPQVSRNKGGPSVPSAATRVSLR